MIISRTPYRISFFGGGSDYAPWYENHGGAVLSTTIDKYCYITARYLPPFFHNKSRIVWSKIEEVMDNSEIQHSSVREVLKYLGITDGVEIHHTGDLPARSGLGSSSSFTVGMLNALSALQGKSFNKAGLALEAVHLERDILKENVGIQDQIAAAYGGFNHTVINQDASFIIRPVDISEERKKELQDHCLLFFTGVSRTASDIAKDIVTVQKDGSRNLVLTTMQMLVDMALEKIVNADWIGFGCLLHQSWELKRSLAKNISPQFVDDMYNRGLRAGAIGGKLLGAGGGGFMLFFAEPQHHDKIRSELKEFLHVPFEFENEGSKIIYGL